MTIKECCQFLPAIIGRYNLNPDCAYNICLDGNWLWRRGAITTNMGIDYQIAATACNYTNSLISRIKVHFGKGLTFNKSMVYFDGKRGPEKIQRNANDAKIGKERAENIVKTFKSLLEESGSSVIQLDEGDCELWMYLLRDKTINSIFVTADSDMISICYNHVPDYKNQQPGNHSCSSPSIEHCSTKTPILDNNQITDSQSTVDSCVWVRPNKLVKENSTQLMIYGMDALRKMHNLEARPARILFALSGTDYTDALFTRTMIKNILFQLALGSYVDILNDSSRAILEIVWVYLYLACTTKCSLQRYVPRMAIDEQDKPCVTKNDIDMYIDRIQAYLTFIETGKCIVVKKQKCHSSILQRLLLSFMLHDYIPKSLKVINKTALRFFRKNMNLDILLSQATKRVQKFTMQRLSFL